jgi:HAD superfamily hydrolase (TIGR01509 family)
MEITISGAIFDMDGTLINSLIVWDMIWEEFGRRFCGGKKFVPTPEDDKAIRTIPLKDAMELLHQNYGMASSGAELLDTANEVCTEFYKNEVELKEGTREFLERAKADGIKMCVATATAKDLVSVAIERLDLAKYFVSVLSCADIGKGKEFPDVFLAARKLLGTTDEGTWVFEDSPVALRTAKAAGMPTVGIYDACNPDQKGVREASDIYISEGHSVNELIFK